jgi:hypothetical protein
MPASAVSPLDLPAEVFRAGLDRRKANRAALLEWIRSALVEGVDYGRIHTLGKNKCPLAAQGRASECLDPKHWSRPSLFKPGAEKICGMLGVTVAYPALSEYEQAALRGAEIKCVLLRCVLLDAQGRAIADGMGARLLDQDYGDLNKALKMAAKSAHIDAALRMAGLSEVFTQDIEDMRGPEREASQAVPPSVPIVPSAVSPTPPARGTRRPWPKSCGRKLGACGKPPSMRTMAARGTGNAKLQLS